MGKATTAQGIRKSIDIARRAHERLIKSLLYGLDVVEKDAREAYSASQAGVHNLYTRSWYELTDEQRDEWIKKMENDS